MNNKGDIFKMIGASNHCNAAREETDYYATDPVALQRLIHAEALDRSAAYWEPCCGGGHLSKCLEAFGFDVLSTDKFDHGYGISGIDFFGDEAKEIAGNFDGDILTNPPYSLAGEAVERALELLKPGRHAIFFCKLTFLESQKRWQSIYSTGQLKCLYVCTSRIECGKGGHFTGGSAVAYGWFIFEKGYKGDPIIRWLP